MQFPSDLTRAFLHDAVEKRLFHHADHVHVAFDLLQRHDFCDALVAFSRGLKGIAAGADKPQAYHETITVAFLSLIAEHAQLGIFKTFEEFTLAHPDLMDKTVLERWYPRDRLMSDVARRTFVLPEPCQ